MLFSLNGSGAAQRNQKPRPTKLSTSPTIGILPGQSLDAFDQGSPTKGVVASPATSPRKRVGTHTRLPSRQSSGSQGASSKSPTSPSNKAAKAKRQVRFVEEPKPESVPANNVPARKAARTRLLDCYVQIQKQTTGVNGSDVILQYALHLTLGGDLSTISKPSGMLDCNRLRGMDIQGELPVDKVGLYEETANLWTTNLKLST